MTSSAYVSSLISTLFRVVAFVFLRVIPLRAGKILLPTLYLAYLISLPLASTGATNSSATVVEVDTKSSSDKLPADVEAPEDDTSPVLTLLLSLPTQSRIFRLLSLLFNTILLAFAVDLVVHPLIDPAHDATFVRIGAVNPDSAKVVVRYPQFNSTEGFVKVVYRAVTRTEDSWKDGPIIHLTEENDWVNTGKITGLWPSTTYEYMLSHKSSTFDPLPYPSSPLSFRTFPDPRLPTGSHFRFIVSSCTMPNFPYFPGQYSTIKGFDLLADYIWPETTNNAQHAPNTSVPIQGVPITGPNGADPSSIMQEGSPPVADPAVTGPSKITTQNMYTGSINGISKTTSSMSLAPPLPSVTPQPHISELSSAPTEFMLFLGDFIYADVPYYYGDDKEAYRRLYRRNYASKSFRKVYEQLPIFHMYDDHEIINNFAGFANDSTLPFPNASSAFDIYQAQANYDSPIPGHYYYDFRYGDVAFFVMDTRRYRSKITEGDAETHTMLGDKQAAAFHAWLAEVNQTTTFKFIVSSVPFTSLWQHDAVSDSWAGFAAEKSSILAAIHSVPNVVILSGDRHEFAAIEYTSPSSSAHQVLEFSTSPLSMFYVPFFRTLVKESERVVERRVRVVSLDEDGREHVGETTKLIPEEKVLQYIATGNYKWSAFEIDTRDLDNPVAHVEVMIDGRSAYRLRIAGTPVKLRTSTALGALFPKSFRGMLGKLGLSPSKWF